MFGFQNTPEIIFKGVVSKNLNRPHLLYFSDFGNENSHQRLQQQERLDTSIGYKMHFHQSLGPGRAAYRALSGL